MIKNSIFACLMLLISATSPAFAKAKLGEPAPPLMAEDIYGQTFNLADHKGKIVVLEWTDHMCPCVQKHYQTNHMQTLQKEAVENGVIWVSLVSSAPDSMGYETPEQAQKIVRDQQSHETTRILDPTGKIGKAFGATATPHMFVIDQDGKLAYTGAIDDSDSYDPATVATAHNYVQAAIGDLQAGNPVSTPMTQPFGCPIHYSDEYPSWDR